jgi:hypothetical protein
VHAVRAFLGLPGYYRRFIRNYGAIATPLTVLLRKYNFRWSAEAADAFRSLQRALTTASVLQLPHFGRDFIVECDASGSGFGVVLHQGDGPVAFFSKQIASRHAKLAAYKRELIGLVIVVHHWRHYLWGHTFLIRTDHFSLKFLLDQRQSTIPQHQWLSKLLGFYFRVEFKPGASNIMADALSHRDAADTGEVLALTAPTFKLYDDLRVELAGDPVLRSLCDEVRTGVRGDEWKLIDGIIAVVGRIYILSSSSCLPAVLAAAHGVTHEGVERTLHRLQHDFFLPDACTIVRDHVRACVVCQQNKVEQLRPGGLLQPLEVLLAVWADIAMDFIEGFPRINGKSIISTVVDRLSKFAHFIPPGHPYTATSVARAFFTNIVHLHGLPSSIISDRDLVFTSKFWQELFALTGVKLNLSSAFHPQLDGQSEAENKVITMYLRCLRGDRPRQWLQWFPWAEYCYNTAFHSSLKTTPFNVVYGRDPPSLLLYDTGARLPAVHHQLQEQDEFLLQVRERLEQAQRQYKEQYDRKHRELHFTPGEWVWLSLLHRPMVSLDIKGRGKLEQKFYGPFKILKHMGDVAYKLELPVGAKLHDVLHVGLLKPFRGEPSSSSGTLPLVRHGHACLEPLAVTKGRVARGKLEVLVQWKNMVVAEASWVILKNSAPSILPSSSQTS